MPQYALGVTYDGAQFHGWQRQADQPTVQGALEAAISRVANETTSIRVAGRTDAGVHATGQVAAFNSMVQRSLHDWHRGINALSPACIHLDWVVPVEDLFHPRYSATARRYVYVFHDIGRSHPILAGRVWGCAPLDADLMHRAGQSLLGEHDFSAFRGAGCQSQTPFRRVNRLEVARRGEFVTLEIEANAFVLHMVRNIARALHDVGSAQASLSVAELLAERDRTLVGATAPPDGLYLAEVSYPDFALPDPAPIPFLASD